MEDKVYAILKLEVESSYQMVYLYFYCYVANSEEDIVKNFRDDLYSYFDRIPRGLSKISDFKEKLGSYNYDLNEETRDVELIDFKIYSDPLEFYIDMKGCWMIEKNPEETKNERYLEDINFIYRDLTVNDDYNTSRVIMVRDLADNIFQYNMDFMTEYRVSYDPYKIPSK